MKTERIVVNEDYYNSKVHELAQLLRKGGLIAFPTETVYGLGGNALDSQAATNIYRAKGRPSDNPLIVHIADPEDVKLYVSRIRPVEEKLIQKFWPGSLTIVFPKKNCIPKETSGGLDTVALRCPIHPAIRALIRASGVPIAGPSANISGRPSPTDADGVLRDMDGKIAAVIDGGPSAVGIESTIVAVKNETIIIYRPGIITKEMLETVAPVIFDTALISETVQPKAPGMKYRHYAPNAPLTVYKGDVNAVERHILAYKNLPNIGFFVSQEMAEKLLGTVPVFIWGKRNDQTAFAHHLFSGLLYFNTQNVVKIIVEGTEDDGVGVAIMNRLEKASGHSVINVHDKI